jgi:predicted enzyme related to lactoylglutathione lyase
MITGCHSLIHSKQADEMRAFFRDTLKLKHVDAGGGWLIFALPPAELAVHPTEKDTFAELYLICDDVHATVTELQGRGVTFTREVSDQGWGLLTAIRLPDGSEMGLYQPKHPVAATLR